MAAFGRTNCTETTMALMALPPALASQGISYAFCTQSFPDIGELRNMLLTLWYDRLPEYTHMLMVDADMGFPPELVLDQFAFDQPLVGCLYPKKTNPISFVGRGKSAKPIVDRGFVEVDGMGFGVTLIRRDCVTAMLDQNAAQSDDRLAHHIAGALLAEWGVKRIIRAFDPIETPTGKLSEDLSFCRRHRDSGGTVWANGNHKITHVGPYGFSGRFLDHDDQRKDRVHVEFADRCGDGVKARTVFGLPPMQLQESASTGQGGLFRPSALRSAPAEPNDMA